MPASAEWSNQKLGCIAASAEEHPSKASKRTWGQAKLELLEGVSVQQDWGQAGLLGHIWLWEPVLADIC